MKYIYIYICMLALLTISAQNLVPNSSFETYTTCPNSGSQIEYATPWSAATSNSSTDYYNSCSIGVSGVPYNSGFQYPRTGNAYAGLILYHASGLREYLQVQLTTPMVQNKTYYVAFFTNLNNGIWNSSCNNIAANLSVMRPFTSACCVLQQLTPHIIYTGNPIITDTLNWIKVSGCYTAQGGEEFLTIGNFYDNATTAVTGTTGIAHYYVDDVSIVEITGTCVTGINELSTNFNFEIYPNPNNGVLNLKLSDDGRDIEIEIRDVLGREVLVSNYKEQLDISQLEKGIYFLSVYHGHNFVGTKKIIIE